MGILCFLWQNVSFSTGLFDPSSNFPPGSSLTTLYGGGEVSSSPAIYALLLINEVRTVRNSYLLYFPFSLREPLAVQNICQESRKENTLGVASLEAFHSCHREINAVGVHTVLI